MKRFASVTFDGVLAACEREAATRTLGSLGLTATSWATALGRTYARVAIGDDPGADRVREALDAKLDVPARAAWRIVPRFVDRLGELADAFGGPGAPAGVRDVRTDASALVVEFDPTVTAPDVVLALADVAVGGAALRRIEPLVPLDDEILASLAGTCLREPDLAADRLIETYLEPLLAGERA